MIDHHTISSRKRVLQVSFCCDPISSMECRLGWHRAIASAEKYDTWVICDAAYQDNIERHLANEGEVPGLTFLYLPFEQKSLISKYIDLGIGYRSYYRAYHDWHRRAFELAEQLHQRHPFDLTHQIGLCGYREAGYLWKLNSPFLWGPIGGTQNFPWRFLPLLSASGAAFEFARNIINIGQLRYHPRVKLAAERATKLYAANTTTQTDFQDSHHVQADLQLETGIAEVPPFDRKPRDPSKPLRILWSGRFRPWKALPILLHALKDLNKTIDFEVRIIGYQSSERTYRRLTGKLGLDRQVTWLGWPPYAETLPQYQWADVFAFTSLRDTSGTGLLEALAHGCPIIGVDHQGARDIMTPECAVPIPVTTPRETIQGFRDAIVELSQDNDRLERLSHGAHARAGDFLWSNLGARMLNDYSSILQKTTHPTNQSHSAELQLMPGSPSLKVSR